MLANHKGEIPVVILLLPFLAGIGLALSFSHLISASNGVILLLCLSSAFIIFNISYKALNLYQHQWIGGVMLHGFLFCAGWVLTANYSDLNKANHFSKHHAQYLRVKIINEPVIKNGSARFVAGVMDGIDSGKQSPLSGKLLISIKDSLAFNLNYGDIILIPAKYNALDPPFNPAEFNYKRYLAYQNIFHQAFLYHGQYTAIAHNAGNPLIASSLTARKKLVAKFSNAMHDSSAIAVASTMILGYKADMSEDVLQTYANTGTLHVLSVSGAHVAIIFMLLNWSFSFLNRFSHGRLIKTFLIITLIAGYAVLTGFSPAVNRAALMISLIIIGNNCYRYINSLNLLAVSAFALLLYNPYNLTDIGFQLSYLAVGGLIIFEPILYTAFVFDNKWMAKLWKLCSVSIAAQLITFPLSAYYFHQFPVYFLLSNLFILLPVIAIMYIGLAFLLFSGLPHVSEVLACLLEKCIVGMNNCLALVERLPFAKIDKLWISELDYILMYTIIVLFFYFLFHRRKLFLNVSLMLAIVLWGSIGWKKIGTDRSFITFLNLKKHRAIVFRCGTSGVVISDIAPTDRNYQYSVQPGLDSAGVDDIRVISFADNINLSYLKKGGNLIQFQNKKLVILDSSANNVNLAGLSKVDYVYLTHNALISTKEQKFSSSLFVISADNTDRSIHTLKKNLVVNGSNYYSLKRNKALTFAVE